MMICLWILVFCKKKKKNNNNNNNVFALQWSWDLSMVHTCFHSVTGDNSNSTAHDTSWYKAGKIKDGWIIHSPTVNVCVGPNLWYGLVDVEPASERADSQVLWLLKRHGVSQSPIGAKVIIVSCYTKETGTNQSVFLQKVYKR